MVGFVHYRISLAAVSKAHFRGGRKEPGSPVRRSLQ